MHVWFTRGLSNTYDAIRLIKEDPMGSDVVITASHTNPESPVSGIADHFHVEALTVDPEIYAAGILERAVRDGIQVVVAQRHVRTLWAWRVRFLDHGVRLVVPVSPDVMTLLDQKDRFCTALEGIGMPTTAFMTFRRMSEFEDAHDTMKAGLGSDAVLCVKPVTGIYGSGFRILTDSGFEMDRMMNPENLEIATDHFRTILAESRQDRAMMLMPFLPGLERSVDFLSVDGRFVSGVARVKHGKFQVIELVGPAIEAARTLSEMFTLNGICNLQTREADGVQHVLEINPRMSGGMQMACLSGINLPLWNVLLAMDPERDGEIPSGRDGFRVEMTTIATVLP